MPKKSEEKISEKETKISLPEGEIEEIAKASKEKKASKKVSQLEFEKKVKELALKGLTSEKIGEELKQQGIHSKEYGKKISQILEKDYINPDLKNVEAKLEKVQKHIEENKQDKKAAREKDRIFAQLRKLRKYFKVPVNKH